MQSSIRGTVHRASEAISGAMEPNKKVAQLKHEYRVPDNSTFLTSDFGTKNPSHDISLSASTGDRKGPLLMEDNLAREKVRIMIMEAFGTNG
jgi:catalase